MPRPPVPQPLDGETRLGYWTFGSVSAGGNLTLRCARTGQTLTVEHADLPSLASLVGRALVGVPS